LLAAAFLGCWPIAPVQKFPDKTTEAESLTFIAREKIVAQQHFSRKTKKAQARRPGQQCMHGRKPAQQPRKPLFLGIVNILSSSIIFLDLHK
jgi:hypothetical protein